MNMNDMKILTRSKIIFILGIIFLSSTQIIMAQSQDADRFFNPFPETGAWFANDDSNTGFVFEIQNGILAGAYFGFDNDGNNVWFIFSGKLQPRLFPGQQIQDGWRIETDLLQFANGKCIFNCVPGDDPVMPVREVVGQIVIEFSGRSEATFQVDDSEPVPIIPLYFGNHAFVFDPEQPLRFLPNLSGTWVVAMSSAFFTDVDPHTLTTVIDVGVRDVVPIESDPQQPARFLEVRFPITRDQSNLFPENSEIVCSFFVSTDETEMDSPVCNILFSLGPMTAIGTNFDLITDSRFTMFQSSDVVGSFRRFDFFRLDYD